MPSIEHVWDCCLVGARLNFRPKLYAINSENPVGLRVSGSRFRIEAVNPQRLNVLVAVVIVGQLNAFPGFLPMRFGLWDSALEVSRMGLLWGSCFFLESCLACFLLFSNLGCFLRTQRFG